VSDVFLNRMQHRATGEAALRVLRCQTIRLGLG